MDAESTERMQDKYEEYHLSARTYEKILKTARTIADMAGMDDIHWEHLQEAFMFRNPDKNYWRRTTCIAICGRNMSNANRRIWN